MAPEMTVRVRTTAELLGYRVSATVLEKLADMKHLLPDSDFVHHVKLRDTTKKLHGARFETHPRIATLLGFLQEMLEQLFRHALAPVRRGRAHRLDFSVLRVEFFEGPTPR